MSAASQGVGVRSGAINVRSGSVDIKVTLVGVAKQLLPPEGLSQDLRTALEFGVRRAKGAAPFRTGELRESIGYESSGLRGRLYATADHAMPVEMGHRTRSGSFVGPRPYLRPAADETFQYLVKLINRRLGK